jgi:hypothetical protein
MTVISDVIRRNYYRRLVTEQSRKRTEAGGILSAVQLTQVNDYTMVILQNGIQLYLILTFR